MDVTLSVIVLAGVTLAGSLFTILRQYIRSLFHDLADMVRAWRGRQSSRTIKIRSGDDTLELSGYSTKHAEEVIKEFLERYPPGGGERVDE